VPRGGQVGGQDPESIRSVGHDGRYSQRDEKRHRQQGSTARKGIDRSGQESSDQEQGEMDGIHGK